MTKNILTAMSGIDATQVRGGCPVRTIYTFAPDENVNTRGLYIYASGTSTPEHEFVCVYVTGGGRRRGGDDDHQDADGHGCGDGPEHGAGDRQDYGAEHGGTCQTYYFTAMKCYA